MYSMATKLNNIEDKAGKSNANYIIHENVALGIHHSEFQVKSTLNPLFSAESIRFHGVQNSFSSMFQDDITFNALMKSGYLLEEEEQRLQHQLIATVDDDSKSQSVQSLPQMTPIRLIFEIFASDHERNEFKNVIDRACDIPIEQQLNALTQNEETALYPSINQMERTLIFRIFPDHLATAKDILWFQSILWKYKEQRIGIKDISPIKWNGEQLALSLMKHSMNQLFDDRKRTDNVIWSFIHYLFRFTKVTGWNGQRMNEFWNETTRNGSKPDDFGRQFVQTVISHFGIEYQSFMRVQDTVTRWYLNAFTNRKQRPSKLIECSVEDVITLFTFKSDTNYNSDHGHNPVDGVLSRFENIGGDNLKIVMKFGGSDWKHKILKWIRTDKVDGKMLSQKKKKKLLEDMMTAVLSPNTTGYSQRTKKNKNSKTSQNGRNSKNLKRTSKAFSSLLKLCQTTNVRAVMDRAHQLRDWKRNLQKQMEEMTRIQAQRERELEKWENTLDQRQRELDIQFAINMRIERMSTKRKRVSFADLSSRPDRKSISLRSQYSLSRQNSSISLRELFSLDEAPKDIHDDGNNANSADVVVRYYHDNYYGQYGM